MIFEASEASTQNSKLEISFGLTGREIFIQLSKPADLVLVAALTASLLLALSRAVVVEFDPNIEEHLAYLSILDPPPNTATSRAAMIIKTTESSINENAFFGLDGLVCNFIKRLLVL